MCRIIAIVMAAITFFLLGTFPGWHEEVDDAGSEREVKSFPSRNVSRVAWVSVFVASVLMLVSVLGQHVAAVATATTIRNATCSTVATKVGAIAMTVGWIASGCFILVTLGLLVLILLISLWNRLVDDE